MEQERSIDGRTNEKRAEGQAMEGKLQEMVKSLGVGSKEEMKFLREIQELKKCRPKVAQVKTMEASVVGSNPLQGSKGEHRRHHVRGQLPQGRQAQDPGREAVADAGRP
jgi:hypothetical protein